MPIAKLLGMPEDSKNDLTSSQRDENEQLKIILQHWSNKNNVVEDLYALREALESLKQEGNLSRHFPLFFFLSSLVFFFWLRSHQASQQTNSGRARDQPGLHVPQASFISDYWM